MADSFNVMSAQLSSYFKALNTMAEIDRAILSSLETDRIATTALEGILSFLPCKYAAILVIDGKRANMARRFALSLNPSREVGDRWIECPTDELLATLDGLEYLLLDAESDILARLRWAVPSEVKSMLMVPVVMKGRLAGLLNVGFGKQVQSHKESRLQVRRLADQMAVALSNSALVEELEQMNWGTLQALARTVDAKSQWTAGHSERVADISLRIARELDLNQKELNTLHRAALLHDIGKIGVSSAILDKKGKLTDEEFRLIKEHPSIGARILEPVGAYRDAIPLVYQHHERLDGSGYPRGLAGMDIVLGARILAVGDVFDALVSNRPYREGSSLSHAAGIIREGAGTLFDPAVVSAFLKVYGILT
jgi:putative nucleotidyltransferase with HDIG domain